MFSISKNGPRTGLGTAASRYLAISAVALAALAAQPAAAESTLGEPGVYWKQQLRPETVAGAPNSGRNASQVADPGVSSGITTRTGEYELKAPEGRDATREKARTSGSATE